MRILKELKILVKLRDGETSLFFVKIAQIVCKYILHYICTCDIFIPGRENTNMNVGEKIGYYAKQKKVTLRRLASESGINYNTLYAIVSRNSNRVSDENIKSIAKVLGIPAEDLETDTPLREVAELSDAELKLSATINSIVGLSTGKDKEDKLYLINSFLEAQSALISDCYNAMKR